MSRVICCEDRRYRYCESEDGRYRYWLEAKLEDRNGVCLFLMLNPATKNADQECKRSHRTRKKCEEFSRRWGYGTLWTCNLFALRSEDPKELKEVVKREEAIGADNDLHIVQKAHRSDMIVCAWGNKGKYHGHRGREVAEMLRNEGLLCKMHYLAMTGKCQPMHPLFIKRDALPKPFVDAPAYFQCN